MGKSSIDEDARRRFEEEWCAGEPAAIAAYLPAAHHPEYLATLEELVLIDLEFSWRRSTGDERGTLIEDYLALFPALEKRETLLRLIEEEYLVRSRYGDRPDAREYGARFPSATIDARELETTRGAGTDESIGPGVRLGRYLLEVEHARGAFGLVWRARDCELDREVALKQLNPRKAADAGVRARFLAEARFAARLEHPGIVPVYEMDEGESGTPFYAMKLVRGRTLAAAIEEFHAGGAVGEERDLERLRLVNVFLALVRAVAYAHGRGVIHRDLKPENIVLGDFGETIILDWGVARALRAEPVEGVEDRCDSAHRPPPDQTSAGTLIGTPAYMSPEQADGRLEDVDERSDVFSLGVILYQLLSGHRPFEGVDTEEVLERLRRGGASNPRTFDSSLPRPLVAICLRAMAHAREQRYRAAEELAEDLERFLGDAPVSAYRSGPLERLGRWARHHRSLVAAGIAGAVLVAIAVFIGLLMWQGVEREREHRTARLRQSVAAEEATALAELRSDRPLGAAEALSRALVSIDAEGELGELRPGLEQRRAEAVRLARFQTCFGDAWYRAGCDSSDPAASALARRGLEMLGGISHERWWTKLPGRDLDERQRERLRQDALRLVLLLAILRAMPALENPAGAAARAAARSALEILRSLRGWRRVQVAQLLESYCRYLLGEIELAEIEAPPAVDPIDRVFLGFIHLWLHSFADDPASRFIAKLGPRVPGLDFDDPLGRAEQYFRGAVQLEPDRYWHHFMLGWVLSEAGRPREAEMAFTTCIALRTDMYQGYLSRAQEILTQHQHDHRPELLQRALADLENAHRLAPNEAEVCFVQVRAFRSLGDHPAVLRAFLEGLQLLPAFFDRLLVLDRSSFSSRDEKNWRGWLNYAEQHLGEESTRASALLAEGYLGILLAEAALVQHAVEELSRSPAESRQVEFLRAALHLRSGRNREALSILENLAASEPGDFLICAARARCLELLDRRGDALRAWSQLRAHVGEGWRKREVERARQR